MIETRDGSQDSTALISIVTVAYNSEATIADTLRSVNCQSHTAWEHLVIDGLSTDSTVSVVNRFEDSRRRVVSESDSGVYNAMNKGVRQVTGEIVGFLNADDAFESESSLSLIAEAFEDEELDLVYGNLRYVSAANPDRVIRDWVSCPYRQGLFERAWVPPHPTVYARRRVFESIGHFDDSFRISADWEWLFRALEVHRLRSRFINEHLVRMKMGGVSNRSLGNMIVSNREVLRAFRMHHRRIPLLFFPHKILHRGRQFFGKLS